MLSDSKIDHVDWNINPVVLENRLTKRSPLGFPGWLMRTMQALIGPLQLLRHGSMHIDPEALAEASNARAIVRCHPYDISPRGHIYAVRFRHAFSYSLAVAGGAEQPGQRQPVARVHVQPCALPKVDASRFVLPPNTASPHPQPSQNSGKICPGVAITVPRSASAVAGLYDISLQWQIPELSFSAHALSLVASRTVRARYARASSRARSPARNLSSEKPSRNATFCTLPSG
ncbi:hypothetical protein BLA13014_03391 [Burkholderia aenigmatica]|uniref:Uncharacterized protein n=1 Tax=Burkholderia aenigmatica TaxID=2015348 RepID=A0A6P2LUT0_9BURK|nr:hypothetical protein BLA13014_03391 [Burkholderia aenigmatica]